MQTFLIGLLALVIGAAFCLAGYRFILFLLPIWGFFAGFSIGASAMVDLFGGGFLATTSSWLVGIVVGLVFAVLSYLFYYFAVALLGASVGYLIGTGFMALLGIQPGVLSFVVGVLAAAVLAGVVLILNVPKLLLILLSALGGAAIMIAGLLLLLGRIPLEALRYGVVGSVIQASWFWLLVWLVAAGVGLVVQWESTQRYTVEPQLYPM
jgi:Domain of unknown function (DUF4203)